MPRLAPSAVRLACIAVTACAMFGCESSSSPRLAALVLSSDSAALRLGDSLRLVARAVDDAGDTVPPARVAWISFDTVVAPVDSTGLVRGLTVGPARIVAVSDLFTRAIPVAVTIALDHVDMGDDSACALAASGAAYCWGAYPRLVQQPQLFTKIAVSRFITCGLTAAADAWCWGGFTQGRGFASLGDGVHDSSAASVNVAGGYAFRDLVVGESYACGLTSTDDPYCWGWSSFDALGAVYLARSPVPVASGLKFRTLSLGLGHVCGLTSAAEAWCWGYARYGQLGDSTSAGGCSEPCSSAAVRVAGGLTFRAIAAGGWHTCGVTTAGEAWCWGRNDSGELGTDSLGKCWRGGFVQGAFPCSQVPERVETALRFVDIVAGYGFSCGLTASGEAWCWGEIGATAGPTPSLVAGGHRWTSIEAGAVSSCGMAADGLLYCWGNGRPTPERVAFQP